MNQRRVPAWKGISLLLGVLALGAGGLALWIHSRAGRAFSEMELRLSELTTEVQARNPSRPVLRGDPVPGNAWDDYLGSVALWPKGTLIQFQQVRDFLDRKAWAPRDTLIGQVASTGASLERLRAGTRRKEVRTPFDWTLSFIPVNFSQMDAMNPCISGLCRSRLLREEGQLRESMEVLLDLCQFGRDLCQNSTPDLERHGKWILEAVLKELIDLIQTSAVPSGERIDLDRELSLLDESWPNPGPTYRNLAAIMGLGLSKEERSGCISWHGPESRFFHSWRWLFSSRLRVASTFSRTEAWSQAAICAEDLPWMEHKKAHEEIIVEIARWPEPIVRLAAEPAFRWPYQSRDVRARLRLLRLAAHFLATGELLPQADPFGGKLGCSASSVHLKAWSVGPDGIDDGGSGDWNSGKDIVLEVDR